MTDESKDIAQCNKNIEQLTKRIDECSKGLGVCFEQIDALKRELSKLESKVVAQSIEVLTPLVEQTYEPPQTTYHGGNGVFTLKPGNSTPATTFSTGGRPSIQS
jgi:hypothetical protein